MSWRWWKGFVMGSVEFVLQRVLNLRLSTRERSFAGGNIVFGGKILDYGGICFRKTVISVFLRLFIVYLWAAEMALWPVVDFCPPNHWQMDVWSQAWRVRATHSPKCPSPIGYYNFKKLF